MAAAELRTLKFALVSGLQGMRQVRAAPRKEGGAPGLQDPCGCRRPRRSLLCAQRCSAARLLSRLLPQLPLPLSPPRCWQWFHRMVDRIDGELRLYYKYDPARRRHIKDCSPVRDLGTVADLGVLQASAGS